MGVTTDAPLAPLTTLQLGGPADRLVTADDEDGVVDAVREADAAGEPVLLLAGGSNLVIADAGFPGLVVRVATRGIDQAPAEDGRMRVTVQAGEEWDAVVAAAVADDLTGIECLSGIPGSTGATPIQNVGAYGQEVSATITAVRVLDRRTGTVEELPPEACGFAYRSSAFKGRDTHAVLAVTFSLARAAAAEPVRYAELARALEVDVGAAAPLEDVREAVLRLRRGKGMVIDPDDPDSVSAGSFFTNPILDASDFEALARRAAERLGDTARPPRFPEADGRVKTSAAWLIERAGFSKGYGDGRIGISAKHALALVNRGGGTTAELVALAREIAGGVRDAFGVDLRPEPTLVGVSLEAG
ncbi:MAG TPA: UDP-N-acetylmuramate dehydrogenase [Solirubrobacteraceae bacterium]|nr:UDP-N-acetylmuramate dehydrogenase [Solirubrobacteraceae bacterium]